MLTRGADGRLYRVDANGLTIVGEEEYSQTVRRVAARGSMDVGAGAEIFSSSAEIYAAKM